MATKQLTIGTTGTPQNTILTRTLVTRAKHVGLTPRFLSGEGPDILAFKENI
jgi:hypothetical protein